MKIIQLIIFVLFYKSSLYKSNISRQYKKTLNSNKSNNVQITNKELSDFSNKQIFSPSDFLTQITIFRDDVIRFSADKLREGYLQQLEPQSTNSSLIDQIKSAPVSLESKIINLFIYRLDNLNELQQELIKAASQDLNRDIGVFTSFILSEQQKLQLLKVIRKKLGVDVQVEFQTTEDVRLGIQLRDRGYIIFSSIDIFITELVKKPKTQVGGGKSQHKELIHT